MLFTRDDDDDNYDELAVWNWTARRRLLKLVATKLDMKKNYYKWPPPRSGRPSGKERRARPIVHDHASPEESHAYQCLNWH
mmetsp:Transcript_10777/g.16176  ORF Transcript_10777/g.16176 Transcript_10777/m.16176 type:complete len:81 (+) Transcript_10777:154-396(+)